jgi:hypothetical protein
VLVRRFRFDLAVMIEPLARCKRAQTVAAMNAGHNLANDLASAFFGQRPRPRFVCGLLQFDGKPERPAPAGQSG